MKNQSLFIKIAYSILTLSFIQIVFSIANGIINHDLFFNNDALYLPWLYKSLFVDKHAFSSMWYSGAPYFFPDFVIFIPIRLISGSFAVASIVTSIIIFIGIIVCFVKLYDYIVLDNEVIAKSLFLSAVSIYILLISQKTLFVSSILFTSPVWHEGSILASLILLIMFFRSIKKDSAGFYTMVFIVSALTSFSDKSLLKDLVLPLTATFFVLILKDLKYINKLYKFFIFLLLGVGLGLVMYKIAIPNAHSFSEPAPWYLANAKNMEQTFIDIFSRDKLSINVATIERPFPNHLKFFIPLIFTSILTACGITIYNIYLFLSANNKQINTGLVILSSFILFQFVFNTVATTLFGYFVSLTHLRYFGVVFVYPVFYLLYLFSIVLIKHKSKYRFYIFYLGLPVFLTLTIRTILISHKGGVLNVFRYKPPNVECLDSVLSDKPYKHGLSDFWNSNTTTLFSKEGAKVNQIATPTGKFIQARLPLISTKKYIGNDYHYILTERLDEEYIKKELGEPDQVVKCPTTNIFVYDNDDASRTLNDIFSATFFNEILKEAGGSYTIKAVDFQNFVSKPYHYKYKSIEGEITPEGYLKPKSDSEAGVFSLNPVVFLDKGDYLVDLTYSANGNMVGVYNLLNPAYNKLVRLNFKNTNGVFETQRTKVEIHGDLALLSYFSGNGELLIKELTITKVD